MAIFLFGLSVITGVLIVGMIALCAAMPSEGGSNHG